MRTILKVAAVRVAMGAGAILPAKAQPYGYRYYGNDSASGYPAAPYGYGDDGYYDDGGYYQGAYDDGYYGAGYYDAPYANSYYDDGYYGADAYGYCDTYGCPDSYWNLPIYYGPVFYNAEGGCHEIITIAWVDWKEAGYEVPPGHRVRRGCAARLGRCQFGHRVDGARAAERCRHRSPL